MTQFVTFIASCIAILFNTINSVSFDLFGYSVSLGFILLSMIIISMVVSVFWKGAKG